jgi:FMN phosphatase YigB (HAD superfamily)
MQFFDFKNIILSQFNKTWIFDIDGTVLKHNGYKEGKEYILDGIKEFFASKIHNDDFVLFLTNRDKKYAEPTEKFLRENGIRFNLVIYEVPLGERILFNDTKPTGLRTSYGICLERDAGLK